MSSTSSSIPSFNSQDSGQAEFVAPSSSGAGKFNLMPMDGVQVGDFTVGRGSNRDVRIGTIANNSGGQIPGQSPGAAAAQSKGTSRSSPGTSDNLTDIERGFRSGGQTSAWLGASKDPSRSPYGRVPASRGRGNDESGLLGLDLKAYLPGGNQQRTHSDAIHGPGQDLFQHVSARMAEHCRLGLLFDCR
jgi:hypothetical protein